MRSCSVPKSFMRTARTCPAAQLTFLTPFASREASGLAWRRGAVLRMPQVKRGDRAIRVPPCREPLDRRLVRQLIQAVDALNARPDPKVVHREDVWPTEGKDEKHLRRPWPYALH